MARRTHTTDLGCIVCKDLEDLGAGKEGWLANDHNLFTALDTHSLALASRTLILILGWSDQDGSTVKIRPDLSPIGPEYVSAIEWLEFADHRVLLVGTSKGYLMVYSVGGVLIHRQMIYPGRILKLRVRGVKKEWGQDIVSEEVTVVLPGVVARIDGSDIQNMLEKWFQNLYSQSWDLKSGRGELGEVGNSYEKLSYQLWNVSKYGTCVDAAITGNMPPPLLELQSSQRYYCAITVGEDAVISAFRLSEDKNRSLVGAILSKVVPAAISTVTSFSKLLWRSEQPSSPGKSEEKPQPFAKASALTCLKDHPRKGEKLTLAPGSTLAAITDSLGRVMLLDTQAMVVVRLWKGYRDASCLFMEMMINKDAASSSSVDSEPVKSDYCLCLAIHAPRKGIIEVWQMRTGPRLLTIQCAKGTKILQPTQRLGSMDSLYAPLEVFLLNGDSGQLSVLNRSLH